MNLEELIDKRFSESKKLAKELAVYSGSPAVFSPEAPADNQPGWDGRTQYPRIEYTFDMQADQERKSAGTLSVSLYCKNIMEIPEEESVTEGVVYGTAKTTEIEAEVKACLRDVLLKTGDGTLYAFAWARTDAFTMPEKNHDFVIGSEIRFDILEYPIQETTDPDPVEASNKYIKELYPDSIVIGLDQMEEITEASRDTPVIYCRLISVEKGRETNTVAWMDGRMAVHILCPDSGVRMKMAAAITNEMSLDGEIIMLDDSPMTVSRLQADYQSDYLKEGQIFLTGHYGLLRYREKGHTLRQTKNNYS